MRLYKISTTLSDAAESKRVTKFVGSQVEAASVRKDLVAQGVKRKDIESIEVEVPTDKAGLMEYLNKLVA